MPADKIAIGCRLPHGLVLRHPDKDVNVEVTISGYHSINVINRATKQPSMNFAVTLVDADFWAIWKAAYSTYEPLKKGLIFEARSEQEAAVKGKERSKHKTGFEALDAETFGVQKADK